MARASGKLGEREGRDAVMFERTFAAPVEDVWAAVTEPDRLARWIGTWTGDPRSGSVAFTMTAEGEDPPAQTWEIDACKPPHHLVVRSVDDFGIWTLHLDLTHAAGVTTLSFAQVVHDPKIVEEVGPGWDWYLDRLVAAETGAEPPTMDVWAEYDPALRPHYAAIRTIVEGG